MSAVVWGVAALALVGAVALWRAGRSAAARASHRVGREVTRVTQTLVNGAWIGAAIAGAQWVVLTRVGDPAVRVVVLVVPALLAGVTLARVCATTVVVHGPRRQR